MSRQNVALVSLHAGFSHSSLALQSLRAFCEAEPFFDDIQCFETLVNISHQQLLESLVACQPVLVGFSTYLWNIQASLRLAGLIKQLLPECKLVLGGPEAGPRGVELLQIHDAVDYVIAGEGEAALRDLLRWTLYAQGRLESVSGLHYRRGERIEINPVVPLPVEQIPSPIASGLARFDKPLIYWESSRGCPFRCSFCTSATERLRAFPLARVEADLQVLERLQDKTVKLLDRSFHLGRERTRKLLTRFATTPSGLRFHLELNPDRISPEAMAIFRQAEPGKFQFEIGLQTLQAPVLNAINRQMAVSKALQNIRQLVSMHRHPVHLDLIVGLPGEDAAQCADSLDRVFCLYPEHLQLGILKLLPGTPLLQQAEALGYRWDREPPYEVLSHPSLSFQALARFKCYAELLERLWNSGYLRTTLAGLVEQVFQGSLSACFERLLRQAGEGLARDNLQPDSLFAQVTEWLQDAYAQQLPEIGQWLLWDYAHYSLVSRKTPAWIAQQYNAAECYTIEASRRRLPVLALSAASADLINRLTGTTYSPGRYALWPQQHKKGKPVAVYALDTDENQVVTAL
jgi:anaerobic magnesium-protoporphyrin IX monomethyl ester cyclase